MVVVLDLTILISTAIVLVLEALLMVVLAAGTFFLNMVFRRPWKIEIADTWGGQSLQRPWEVDVNADTVEDCRVHTWQVVGWRNGNRVIRELAARIKMGDLAFDRMSVQDLIKDK